MNNKSVLYLSLGLLACAQGTSLYAVLSKEALERDMTSYHTAAFGNTALFAKPIDQKDINNWNRIVDETEAFVKKNVVLNSDLTNAMKTLKTANGKIMTTITESYRLFYAKPDPKNDSMKKNTAAALQYVVNDVLKVEEQLKQSKTKGHRTAGNQQSAEVLYRLAVSLSTTAEKAQRELRR